MTMDQDDRHFESFLRDFQPRRPRALPAPQTTASTRMRRLAAGFALAAVFGCSIWFLFRGSPPNQTANAIPTEGTATTERTGEHLPALVPLTGLAIQDLVRLDAALTRASRSVLPDLQRKDSTLHLLAKE
jgi:hypothetical protein